MKATHGVPKPLVKVRSVVRVFAKKEGQWAFASQKTLAIMVKQMAIVMATPMAPAQAAPMVSEAAAPRIKKQPEHRWLFLSIK